MGQLNNLMIWSPGSLLQSCDVFVFLIVSNYRQTFLRSGCLLCWGHAFCLYLQIRKKIVLNWPILLIMELNLETKLLTLEYLVSSHIISEITWIFVTFIPNHFRNTSYLWNTTVTRNLRLFADLLNFLKCKYCTLSLIIYVKPVYLNS